MSSGNGEQTLDEIARYTHGDRFKKLPGYKTFTSHYHVEHTVDFLDRQKAQQTTGIPQGRFEPASGEATLSGVAVETDQASVGPRAREDALRVARPAQRAVGVDRSRARRERLEGLFVEDGHVVELGHRPSSASRAAIASRVSSVDSAPSRMPSKVVRSQSSM